MNLSYSTIADVYALAEEDPKLREFGQELERSGTAVYEGTEYVYRDSAYGMEVVSMEDYLTEEE